MKLVYPLVLALLVSVAATLPGLLPRLAHADADERARMEELFYAVLEADDPSAAVLALSHKDRALWQQAMEVVEVKEEPVWSEGPPEQVQTLVTNCWTQQKRRVGENFLGYDLWRFYLRINWCEDGVTVISPVSAQVTVDVNYPFWSYTGVVNQSDSGGPGYTSYSVYRQGEFKYCAPEIACAQYQYPWITLVGYNYNWSSWTGGGGTGW